MSQFIMYVTENLLIGEHLFATHVLFDYLYEDMTMLNFTAL